VSRLLTQTEPWVSPQVPLYNRSWQKRAVDIVGSLVLLLALSPIIGAVVLLVKCFDPGPLFFAWEIVGVGGRRVRSYKFRTMIPHAEALEKTLRTQGVNEMTSVYFKMRNDPRVTPLGRILRKLSLDEIPSLWSVLRGDLSLVGPRPVRVTETEYLKGWHWERFAVRPGLTSPWVLNGKNAMRDFDDIVRSDLDYVRNWSLWRDLLILFNTARYVISGKNH